MSATHKLLNVIDVTRSFVLLEKNDKVSCYQGALHALDKLDDIHTLARQKNADVVFALPYHVIRERGFEAKGDEPILAMAVEQALTVPLTEMLAALPQDEVRLEGDVETSLSDAEYADLVRQFQKNEIEAGNASQTTLARSFTGHVVAFDLGKALSIYRKVLQLKGRYMAVLYANLHPTDPSQHQFIIGATPERHLEISGNDVIMMPIAGTLRKEDRETFPARLKTFLEDPKEINELFQVVDEEMKMMGVICPEGGAIEGPFLHEIGAVVHTEYCLVGRRSSDTIGSLRRTLHAPTVVGSPMESAARIISKYEPVSRRYYAGEVGVYRCPRTDVPNGDLDTAILIRCAEIDGAGAFRVQAGGGLVRDSKPEEEARESRAKAMGLIGALTGMPQMSECYLQGAVKDAALVQLATRNRLLSEFWMTRQRGAVAALPTLEKRRIVILNNEDDFAHMIGHILRVYKADVSVIDSLAFDPETQGVDLVVVGPGPGDPTDGSHPRMKRLQEIIARLTQRRMPMLGVCLGHQALAVYQGLNVLRQESSSQGMQREVPVRGVVRRLAFYNSFSPVFDDVAKERQDILFDTDENNRIVAMRGKLFSGVQFHPESIMSTEGASFLLQLLGELTA